MIEDKNVREAIYPDHREVWDLLCKAGHFPDHVPILIAPRFHYTTFVLFSGIGALAVPTTRQWFAPEIDAGRFREVTQRLAITGAVQAQDPDRASPALRQFFETTVHKATRRHPSRSLLATSQKLWARAAPICAQPEFMRLREQLTGHERKALYRQFLDELYAEGFSIEALLPRHVVYEEAEEPEGYDLEDYDLDY